MSTAGDFTGQWYEKDQRWTDVDHYAIKHLQQDPSLREALQNAKELAEREGLPNIEVSTLQGKFLALQAQLIGAKHILEVGTLGGYSAIWFASTGAHVTSVEINSHHKEVAEEAIREAGLSEQVDVVLGAGVDVLPRLRADVEAGTRAKFDLVFIDADKENNWTYFDQAIRMSRSRALIMVDNVVRRGTLANEKLAESESRVQGARRVVEAVGKDERVLESSLLQTVGEKNYDGFLVAVVR